jgi:glycine/D-amino acid oxidase-like deaminating enzyme/nitrite reductase/ring-hydroxylating ferredoxin subunit
MNDRRTVANDSGSTRSTWMSERVPSFDGEIPQDARPDACVIGAGIAGLSVALALVQDGLDVLVLDQGPIGGGQTARTSAHLASSVDDYYHVLERRFGRKGAQRCFEAHAAAVDAIEQNTQMFGIDCDFRRVDAYLWVPSGQSRRILKKERDASRRVGLGCEDVERAPLPFDTGPCIRFTNQAQFHPLKYLRGIADAIVQGGGRIVTGVHVSDVRSGSPCEVITEAGRKIIASAVVDATNMAITSRFNMQLREAAYRTYMVALEIPHGYVPHGLYYDTCEPYHYIRVQPAEDGGDRESLLVGGEDHRVGQSDPEVHLAKLEDWAREHFPAAGAVVSTWSGQIQEPHDGMAYIGHLPGHSNVYVVTGDSGNGLTHGVIASLMLPTLIQGRKHPWTRVFAPGRSRLNAVGTLAHELAKSNAPYADWVRSGDVVSLDDIPPGHGATIRRGLHVLAAYKDEYGQCHLRNAKCPHLGGVVRWNEVEKSWDCPVHGSRFDCKGEVMNGPAISGLGEAPADIESPADGGELVLGDDAYPLRPV